MDFREIKATDIQQNAFDLIGKDWMLVTAKDSDGVNTMTASWGGMGVLWNKDVCYVFIRPQRYTKKFVDNSDSFSLAFFDAEYKKVLSYLGTVSGRDEDKIKNSNLTLCDIDDVPAFEEAKLVLICRKLYEDDLKKENFLYEETAKSSYPKDDFHTMYIAEITKVLVK